MKPLLALREFFLKYSHIRTYWVAYSGGLDSHALLDMCHVLQIELDLKFQVIHINHQLSPDANAWVAHCENVCKRYGFKYHVERVSIEKKPGESIEGLARDARYAVFSKFVKANEMLLTAHHADDQAETVFLQLLRGAGLPGLAAMPVLKPFGEGWHARPFLNISRAVLYAYVEEAQLKFVEDKSNQDVQLTRNYLRHTIFPLLQARFPTITQTIGRVAEHCNEAHTLLNHFADDLLNDVQGSFSHTVSVEKLLKYPLEKQKLILRLWMRQSGWPTPSAKKLQSILQDVLHSGRDRQPCVEWQGCSIRRYRDQLFLLKPLNRFEAHGLWEWNLQASLRLPGLGKLSLKSAPGGLSSHLSQVTVRFRRPGERIKVTGRGHLSLKNILQECGVPPWQRHITPLLFNEEELVTIVGYYIAPRFRASLAEEGYHLIFSYE